MHSAKTILLVLHPSGFTRPCTIFPSEPRASNPTTRQRHRDSVRFTSFLIPQETRKLFPLLHLLSLWSTRTSSSSLFLSLPFLFLLSIVCLFIVRGGIRGRVRNSSNFPSSQSSPRLFPNGTILQFLIFPKTFSRLSGSVLWNHLQEGDRLLPPSLSPSPSSFQLPLLYSH